MGHCTNSIIKREENRKLRDAHVYDVRLSALCVRQHTLQIRFQLRILIVNKRRKEYLKVVTHHTMYWGTYDGISFGP